MASAGAIAAAQALRAVGCPRDRASTMVATAARESSYVPWVHTYGRGCGPGECGRRNGPGTVCEDSWGLWQINRCAHPQFPSFALVTPLGNAAAARAISSGFSDLSPWRGGASPTAESDQAVAVVYGGAPPPPQPGQGQCPPGQVWNAALRICVDASTTGHGLVVGDEAVQAGVVIPGWDTFKDIVQAVGFLVGFLVNPHNWLRLGMALLGAVLLVVALWFAAKDWQRSGVS